MQWWTGGGCRIPQIPPRRTERDGFGPPYVLDHTRAHTHRINALVFLSGVYDVYGTKSERENSRGRTHTRHQQNEYLCACALRVLCVCVEVCLCGVSTHLSIQSTCKFVRHPPPPSPSLISVQLRDGCFKFGWARSSSSHHVRVIAFVTRRVSRESHSMV